MRRLSRPLRILCWTLALAAILAFWWAFAALCELFVFVLLLVAAMAFYGLLLVAALVALFCRNRAFFAMRRPIWDQRKAPAFSTPGTITLRFRLQRHAVALEEAPVFSNLDALTQHMRIRRAARRWKP